MLDRLFARSLAAALAPLLDLEAAGSRAAAAGGRRVAAMDCGALGRALAARGAPVLRIESRRSRLRGLEGPGLLARVDALPLRGRSLSALVVGGAAASGDLPALVNLLCQDGRLVVLGSGDRCAQAHRALCAGLRELEQRRVGNRIVTTGLAMHFD